MNKLRKQFGSLATKIQKCNLSEIEWRAKLSKEEFETLRMGKTEKAFSNSSSNTKKDGVFQCRGCDAQLFQYHFALTKLKRSIKC
jgi:peptide methionine sulfoxide reductase MsrB